MKPKVATYFEPLNPDRESDDRALIRLWWDSWRKHGWDPVVLGRADVNGHIMHDCVLREVQEFPTVNGKSYEVCCFMRHLAFSALAERNKGFPIIFSDYDMINYGWRLQVYDLRVRAPIYAFFGKTPALFSAHRSGLSWLMGFFTKNWVDHFVQIVDGKPHVSDLTVFQALPIPESRVGKEYGEDGWESAPVVHYGNQSFGPDKRAKRIMQVRPIVGSTYLI